MARQRKKREARIPEIIDGASKLMVEKGVANTSLADIASELGISKGTLFYYYPSKADLIFDISERHLEHMTDRIFSWIDESGATKEPSKVLQMAMETIISSETRGHIHVYLIQEALTGNEQLRQRFLEEYPEWARMIEEGLRRVMDPDRDYSVLARLILATIDGFLLQNLLGTTDVSLGDVSRYLTSLEPPVSRA